MSRPTDIQFLTMASLDAETGEPLVRHRLTEYLTDATYRVWTSDSPSPFSPGYSTPQTNQPPVVPRARRLSFRSPRHVTFPRRRRIRA